MSRTQATAHRVVQATLGLAVVLALGAAGLIARGPDDQPVEQPPDSMGASSSSALAARDPALKPDRPSTSASSSTGPTTSPPPETAGAGVCLDGPDVTIAPEGAPPSSLQSAIEIALADPRLTAGVIGASVWVEGWGEVVSHNGDAPLLPASNQKLATAMGALLVLEPEARLETRILATGTRTGGTLDGDLILVGAGDPTITTSGTHSLDQLATDVRNAGLHTVTGSIVVDESRYSTERAAPGWLDWQQPVYGGALSAVIVDRNQASSDAGYLADPGLAAGNALGRSLQRNGVQIAGGASYGIAPTDAEPIASLSSPTIGQLTTAMLLRSDNMAAETLFREIGIAAGGDGSTASSGAALDAALSSMCIDIAGTAADGSGLSRADARASGEWLRLLHAARDQPWFPTFHESLPIAGRSGTLSGRLGGPATLGNVRAKTGWTIPARGLSGYLTTAGGRDVVFSVIVNGADDGSPYGDRIPGAEYAIDEFIGVIAAWPT